MGERDRPGPSREGGSGGRAARAEPQLGGVRAHGVRGGGWGKTTSLEELGLATTRGMIRG